jgi:hypothetical protein
VGEAKTNGKLISELDSLESWSDRHERYAESFGVDPQLGREALAQHTDQG